jgi:hypothetical protein
MMTPSTLTGSKAFFLLEQTPQGYRRRSRRASTAVTAMRNQKGFGHVPLRRCGRGCRRGRFSVSGLRVARTACLAAVLVPVCARGFSISNIEYWAGSGTNRAALVVDWHDGTRPHALAWGYRWNGNATGLDLWRAVTNADPGLSGTVTQTAAGPLLSGIEYRRPSREYAVELLISGTRHVADVLPGTGRHAVHWSPYTWDHTGAVFQAGAWTYWTRGATPDYTPAAFEHPGLNLTNRVLADGAWDAWSFDPDGRTLGPGWCAPAIHYPFAATAVSYAGAPGEDQLSDDPFDSPQAALGRPTVDTTGDNSPIPAATAAPVVPVYPPFRAFELTGVAAAGHLVVAFDHRVLDHPDNPYGADFILFGNTLQNIALNSVYWTNGNPTATRAAKACNREQGRVLVSQDGTNWIAYPSAALDPGADDFAPTLGRVYDTNRVDESLGAWNAWWGGATDPTVPLDPALAPADWENLSVAELAQRYRGSAGGTAFDLSGLPLTPDPHTGCKWIRYVRIERSVALDVEVDAVADVSPGLPYTLWRTAAFPWMSDPALAADAADYDADRSANLLEYGTGGNPADGLYAPAVTLTLHTTSTPAFVQAAYGRAVNAPDVRLEVVRTEDLLAPDWRTNGVGAAVAAGAPTNGVVPTHADIPLDTPAGFIRLRARHDD